MIAIIRLHAKTEEMNPLFLSRQDIVCIFSEPFKSHVPKLRFIHIPPGRIDGDPLGQRGWFIVSNCHHSDIYRETVDLVMNYNEDTKVVIYTDVPELVNAIDFKALGIDKDLIHWIDLPKEGKTA